MVRAPHRHQTATVSLHGNAYEVDAALVGRRVELVFDPFDLTQIEVRYQDRPMGLALPHRIGRHVHAKARPDETVPPPTPTGIDYLKLIEDRHTTTLTTRLRYAGLTTPDPGRTTKPELAEQIPGQLSVPGTDPDDTTSGDTTSDGQATS